MKIIIFYSDNLAAYKKDYYPSYPTQSPPGSIRKDLARTINKRNELSQELSKDN